MLTTTDDLLQQRIPDIEWPTLGLLALTYGAWAGLLYLGVEWPWWVVAPIAGYVVCLQSSLQHECLHGHPTRIRWLNDLMVLPALALWLPYRVYRSSHLSHHGCDELSHPERDTESFYFSPAAWDVMPRWQRRLFELNNTLLGRLIIGPLIVAAQFSVGEFRRIRHQPRHLWVWFEHAVVVSLLVLIILDA
ncbi:fatty acid desaturase, partial [Gammaproteobacteria bacterium]|nr:fatty acid desaturase [Gammaproteobacteria bacterium]